MSYYHELNLTREPFSNSPDPDFFYRTQDRVECLNLMEVHIRLKRGLCVLLGDIGTGKTTLCRQLLIEMQGDDMLESYLLLDPQFRSNKEFLQSLHAMIVGNDGHDLSELQLKEGLKNTLFNLTQKQGKTVVLLIDEGQRLRHDGIELLRELLNYETNSSKLLQIVVFAQNEFQEALHSYANFADRISTLLHIGPFVFRETIEMIQFRIRETQKNPGKMRLFSFGALHAIHKYSEGYPRKIVTLCHQALLQILIDNQSKVTAGTIRKITRKRQLAKKHNFRFAYAAAIVLVFALSAWFLNNSFSFFQSEESTKSATAVIEPSVVAPAAGPDQQPVSTVALETAPPPGKVAKDAVHRSLPLPEALGDITLPQSISLGGLIAQIYGADRKSYRREMLINNPGIHQSQMLQAGTELHFPPILQTPGSAFKGLFWVELDSQPSLQGACNVLLQNREVDLPVALLASFTPSKGLRFSIVTKQVYVTESVALETLQSLPDVLRTKAKIVRNWGEHAILYTTPDAWPREAGQSSAALDNSDSAS